MLAAHSQSTTSRRVGKGKRQGAQSKATCKSVLAPGMLKHGRRNCVVTGVRVISLFHRPTSLPRTIGVVEQRAAQQAMKVVFASRTRQKDGCTTYPLEQEKERIFDMSTGDRPSISGAPYARYRKVCTFPFSSCCASARAPFISSTLTSSDALSYLAAKKLHDSSSPLSPTATASRSIFGCSAGRWHEHTDMLELRECFP